MKKILASLLLSAIMLLSFSACGDQGPKNEPSRTGLNQSDQSQNKDHDIVPSLYDSSEVISDNSEINEISTVSAYSSNTSESSSPIDNKPQTNQQIITINTDGIKTISELEDQIENYLTTSIEDLKSRWDSLSAEIDTYQKYCDNFTRVSDFYKYIVSETEQMCITFKEYSAVYARMILDSGMSSEKKYKATDGICDCLYDDACDVLIKKIYNGILDDMVEYYYNGILDDEKDIVDYSNWSEVCSNEYSQWSDASSEVYSLYSDTSSEIYSFYTDLSSKIYNEDFERAEIIYKRFLKEIAIEKGIDTGDSVTNPIFDTTVRTANTADELENVVYAHVSECVQALKNEWKSFSEEINTIEKFTDNSKSVKDFHNHIADSSHQIFALICDYGVAYADLILQSDSADKEKYKSFEDFKDCIYEDACKVVKKEIYDGLLKEIKKYYYDGIIKNAKNHLQYSDWFDARSDCYNWWSDAREDVYSDWSDTRNIIYRFFSDIRSELYKGKTEDAKDEFEDFKKKVDKMK